ncbi:acyltransferase [Phascolarctobacterium sp.]|uniref:acyltransferase family protein n=1 Tax=Phascolarctobacterium sp. TaxID=2049039 RepID=UPI002A815C31|nr:acyltransferase [Phascolarctobacterium sp.]MDY5045863.1 acyltransferase [Phascolarctobacterium sp.]
MVVIHHYLLAFAPELESTFLEYTPLRLLYSGRTSVCIFFVLSGFVLSYKFFNTLDSRVLIAGAVKRYFRLLLPVIFSIILMCFLMKGNLVFSYAVYPLTASDWLQGHLAFEPSFSDALYQGFVSCFFLFEASYNSALWTMSWELYGSIIVFVLAFIISRINRWGIFLAAIACLALSKTYFPGFILGLLLSYAYVNYKPVKLLNDIRWKNSLLVLAVLLLSYDRSKNCLFLGGALLIYILLYSKRLQGFFSSLFFVWLGRISFSMYTIHMVILCTFSSFIYLQLPSEISFYLKFLLILAISIPIIFIIAYIICALIDARSIKFSKAIAKYALNKD